MINMLKETHHIKQIIVSTIKMVIKILLCVEPFLAVPTLPFIYIHMNLVIFLISEHVIIRMKSACL